MEITVDPRLAGPMGVIEKFVNGNAGMAKALANTEIKMGMASDPKYMIPASALREPAYVGDAAHVADVDKIIASQEARALYAKNPALVDTRFIFDMDLRHGRMNGKYRLVAEKHRRGVMDEIADAAPDLMGGQVYSPWNVGWFQKIFKAPLLYSHGLELVKVESGTEPWCEIMSLNLADYAGFASLDDSGTLASNAVHNVNVQSGLMSTPVINMTASYDLAIEEMKRAEQSGSPFGSQLITIKQRYADYVLRMLTNYLIYYGNTATETVGLLQVPSSVTAYSGSSMNAIFLGSSSTKGSDMLSALQSILIPFLDSLYNKITTVKIVVSPQCYNRLTAPYSATYNPTAALKATIENFIAGKTKDGTVPDLEFVIEPLFAPSTIFNAQTYDYLLLLAPEMPTGPDEEKQPMLLFGAPLMEFVYPTIPGSYTTQYKFLRRVAGVFAPVQAAVVAYRAFGIASATT